MVQIYIKIPDQLGKMRPEILLRKQGAGYSKSNAIFNAYLR